MTLFDMSRTFLVHGIDKFQNLAHCSFINLSAEVQGFSSCKF